MAEAKTYHPPMQESPAILAEIGDREAFQQSGS